VSKSWLRERQIKKQLTINFEITRHNSRMGYGAIPVVSRGWWKIGEMA
jgi:hypothetical protein